MLLTVSMDIFQENRCLSKLQRTKQTIWQDASLLPSIGGGGGGGGKLSRFPTSNLSFFKLSLDVRKPVFAYAKTKTQISFAVTAKLISAFVFASRIVQPLYFLNPKFQVSSHLLLLYSLVCVVPGRKPRRPVFWRRGSIKRLLKYHHWVKMYGIGYVLRTLYQRVVSLRTDVTHHGNISVQKLPLICT